MNEQNETTELDASSFLAAPTSPHVVKVECPKRGGHVYVRLLSGAESAAWQNSLSRITKDGTILPNRENALARWAALVLCKKDGARLYSDRDATAIGANVDADTLDRIWEEGLKLNRLSAAGKEDARGN